MDRTAPHDLLASPPASALLEQALGHARSGAMTLPELLNTSQSLTQSGNTAGVLALYETWTQITQSPHRFVAYFNWGTVLGAIGKHTQAEQVYRQAIAIKPDFIQAHLNLGHQLEHLGKLDAAVIEWQTVLELLDSSNPPGTPAELLEMRLHALNNLARALEQAKRLDEAQAWMERSLLVHPDQPKVLQHYVHIRQKQCLWPAYQPIGEVTMNQLLLATSPLAMLSASDDPAMQLLAARNFVLERVRPVGLPLHRGASKQPRTPGRLRIAYLSSDLCMHAVGLLMAELLELHDRKRVEVYGFCWTREDGSPLRQRLIAGFDHHIRIAQMSDEEAAKLIAAHDMDVLIDLHGITSGARPDIISYKPAPVQITYLGLPATTAQPGIDYAIADRYAVPDALLPFMTERPLYLPHCYQASDRQRPIGATPTRAQWGLPQDALVYCSFNNNFKITPEVFGVWMRVLRAVPGSVLWLLADNRWSQANMQREAEAAGVDPKRLLFAPRAAPADYLARLQLADLFLDTFPYNAGTTANDVLWMGVPLLTYSGRTFISRMAGSLLTHIGLPDLITTSLAEYEQRAIQLGREPARLASYRRYLAEHGRSSVLFDMPRLASDLEDALEDLVQRADARASGKTSTGRSH